MKEVNWIDASFTIRGSLRKALVAWGVEFSETKSLMSSIFIVHSDEDYACVIKELRRQGFL